MSIRTGMARLASVIRGFGVVVGILCLCIAIYIFTHKEGGGDAGPAVLTGGVLYGICWVIAYVIDGFARDDD